MKRNLSIKTRLIGKPITQMYNLGLLDITLAVSRFDIWGLFLACFDCFLGKHKNKFAIFFLNILLGWIGAGWFVMK